MDDRGGKKVALQLANRKEAKKKYWIV